MLAVDHDPFSGQFGKIKVMVLAAEAHIDAAVHQAFAHHALAEPGRIEQIDGAVFQDAGANAPLAIFARPRLDDHRFDPGAMEQMREHETCRSRPNDSNLSVHAE